MRTYQKIIAGVLVLAGLLGLYGCAKKTDNKAIINETNQTTSIETIANSNNQTPSIEEDIETIIESDDQIPPVETIINSEHENLVDYLTLKLERVKESLYAELSKGNLGLIEYQQKTYQLLCEEGIIQESYKNNNKDFFNILSHKDFFNISSQLDKKLATKTYTGFEKTYIVLEDLGLSTEAQEDCDKYTKLKERTYDYLKKELGNKPVLISEFTTMVKNYLMKQNELLSTKQNELLSRKQNELLSILKAYSIFLDLNKEFNIIYYYPEMSGGYPPEVLEEALDNL